MPGDQRRGPLSQSVRVLDLTRLTAAYATRVMAEAGATVLRVEPPATRGRSRVADPLDAYFNAGNLGLTLDPSRPRGRELLGRLLDTCDALVESQPSAFWQSIGLTPEDISREHPRLIVTSIVDELGFLTMGSDVIAADRPGTAEPYSDGASGLDTATAELLLYAESGLMSITGEPEGPPLLVGGHAALAVAGLQAAIGTYAALTWRRRTGRGQRVRVRLLDALQRLMEQPLLRWSILGTLAGRAGARGGATAINGAFRCRDGHVALSVSADRASWGRFLDLLEPSGLAARVADPALAEEPERWRQRSTVIAVLEEWAQKQTRGELVETFLRHDLPAAPVLTVDDLSQDPQLLARGFLVQATASASGPREGARLPAGAVATTLGHAAALAAAPTPGQDNAAVYGALGYDAAMRGALSASGTI